MEFKGQKSERVYNKHCKVGNKNLLREHMLLRRNNKVLLKHIRHTFNLVKVQYCKLLRSNSLVLSGHLRQVQFNKSLTF